MFGTHTKQDSLCKARASSRTRPAARPFAFERLEGRELFSAAPVTHAAPARPAYAMTPAIQVSAHRPSPALAQRPAAGQQRLVVIAPVAAVLSCLISLIR